VDLTAELSEDGALSVGAAGADEWSAMAKSVGFASGFGVKLDRL
jgi:hypothetical protein